MAAVLLAAAPAFADAPPDELAAFDKDLDALFAQGGLTSEQAAGRAGATSPTVRRKIAEVDAAIASAEATELQQVPQVGIKASYTRLSYIAPISFSFPGAAEPFNIAFFQNSYVLTGNIGVNLSDYVFRYPKLTAAAHIAEDVAKVSRRQSELDAGQDARMAYYEWTRAKLQVLIAARQLSQVQVTLKQIEALAEAQRVTKADLMRVRSQEAEAEQTLDQLQNVAVLREEQLRIQIGAGPDEKLSLGEDIRRDVDAGQQIALDEAVKTAKTQRLDFKTLDLGIEAKEKQRDAEKANEYPRLSAFASGDYDRPNQRYFPQTDAFKFTWQAGIQLGWTLNDTLISSTNLKRLRAETSELRSDRENLERGARVEVLSAQQQVAIAQHALLTSQKALDATQESYRVRQALLAAERATAVELVDAETDLTRARISALNARVDLRVALAQLAHALGNDAVNHK